MAVGNEPGLVQFSEPGRLAPELCTADTMNHRTQSPGSSGLCGTTPRERCGPGRKDLRPVPPRPLPGPRPRRDGGRTLLILPFLLLLALASSAPSRPALAGIVKAAVAANFLGPAQEVGRRFEDATAHRVVFSFGSTGQLYAQIAQGAPFDVYLAADRAHAKKAVDEGLAAPGTRFTYATGAIVLFSRDERFVKGPATLAEAAFRRLAIANPVTAPYGRAAVEALRALGLYDRLEPRLVRGNSIAQTYQFVDTGNAEVGLVALSQVAGHGGGSRWTVPAGLYSPIAQDAVLLRHAAENEAARAFLRFLKGPLARAVKKRYGYGEGG